MRRKGWTIVAAAVVWAVVGCSASPSPAPKHLCKERDRAAAHVSGTTELPVTVRPRTHPPDDMTDQEVEAALPPKKKKPSYKDQGMRRLMEKTVRMVGAKGEVRPGTCKWHVFKAGQPADLRCTVRYKDFETVWRVEYYGGSAMDETDMMFMRSFLVTGLLTARNVYASYGYAFHKEADQRCDRMPEVFQADAGKPTRYDCQSVFWWCSDGEWDGDRRNVSVGIDAQGGIDFRPREGRAAG